MGTRSFFLLSPAPSESVDDVRQRFVGSKRALAMSTSSMSSAGAVGAGLGGLERCSVDVVGGGSVGVAAFSCRSSGACLVWNPCLVFGRVHRARAEGGPSRRRSLRKALKPRPKTPRGGSWSRGSPPAHLVLRWQGRRAKEGRALQKRRTRSRCPNRAA